MSMQPSRLDSGPTIIVFLCACNTGLSPIAQFYAAARASHVGLDIDVRSGGISATEGQPVAVSAVLALRSAGVSIDDGPAALVAHRSQHVQKRDIEAASVIICMTAAHRQRLLEVHPEALWKTVLMKAFVGRPDDDVSDPSGGAFQQYQLCFVQELRPAIDGLLVRLKECADGNLIAWGSTYRRLTGWGCSPSNNPWHLRG